MVYGPVSDELVGDVHAVVDEEAVRSLRGWQRHEFRPQGLRTDFSDRLDAIDVPTLVLHGQEDPLMPVRWSRQAAERLPDGELTVFEDCGHWVARERKTAFNDALDGFCKRIAPC
jgi:pimeloyl-ACP methyl ester carboxylesterase